MLLWYTTISAQDTEPLIPGSRYFDAVCQTEDLGHSDRPYAGK